ncbi:uncharacterized protein TNCV_4972501 [Trichonephila clavipes]|nr:uncharacterized protein TNCV_4972501 [Trichonephila clavipes]
MSRSGGQSEARPPMFKSPSKLGTHLSTHCNGDESLSRSCPARTCHVEVQYSTTGAVGSLVVSPDRKVWVRCPMPPNTLRVHVEYVLVKSVGPKSCGLSRERRDWRIFPSPSFQCRNCGGGDSWCRHLSSLREIMPS